jgi:hypothetical protein
MSKYISCGQDDIYGRQGRSMATKRGLRRGRGRREGEREKGGDVEGGLCDCSEPVFTKGMSDEIFLSLDVEFFGDESPPLRLVSSLATSGGLANVITEEGNRKSTVYLTT